MDEEEYYSRLAFLKHGTVPAYLHTTKRVSWIQGTRNQFSIDYIQRTSGQEAVLLTKSRKTKGTTQQPPAKFVLKRSLLEDTLRTIHEPHHPGRDVMLFEIKRLWYWKGIKKDVTNFLQQCVHC